MSKRKKSAMSEENKAMALEVIHGASVSSMVKKYGKSNARVGVIVRKFCERFFMEWEWKKMIEAKLNNKKICAEVKKIIDKRDSLKIT